MHHPPTALLNHLTTVGAPSNIWFRLGLLSLAIVLSAQCGWLVFPQLYGADVGAVFTNASSAEAAVKHRRTAAWIASVGSVRGDLWTRSALTYSDLVICPLATSANQRTVFAGSATSVAHARRSVDHALTDAPIQSGAWLFLAGLNLLYPTPGNDVTAALRMSYYTGPSEIQLLPLRLLLALRTNTFRNTELGQFISRDVRLLLRRKQYAEIVAAYDSTSSDGKHFVEQVVSDADISFLSTLHADTTPSTAMKCSLQPAT